MYILYKYVDVYIYIYIEREREIKREREREMYMYRHTYTYVYIYIYMYIIQRERHVVNMSRMTATSPLLHNITTSHDSVTSIAYSREAPTDTDSYLSHIAPVYASM